MPEQLRVAVNATGPTWAITNARIVTVSGPVIPRGTIVIKGNRIDAVGANVSVPSGATVVNAAGANVYPGVINAGADIGINEPGVRNYDDVDELLPFKDGAFRLAIDAQVPILPMVVHGTATALRKHDWRLGRSVAEVRVLEPVETTGMKHADVPRLREEVRERIRVVRDEMRGLS